MAEWLVEQGIGEERAILYGDDGPLAARVRWPGRLEPGQVVEGELTLKLRGSTRGLATFAGGGLQAVVDRLPSNAQEGATMRFRVVRGEQLERVRLKPAIVRPTDESPCPAPTLAESLPNARIVRRFPDCSWGTLWDRAVDGLHSFPGGNLEITPASAMTLIDVDGSMLPRELALAAVQPISEAIALMGIGGSIGVDFPSLPSKADRKAVDSAIDRAMADFDHERTAMNGFGFVQIVMRYERPSLVQLVQNDLERAAARFLLWKAEGLDGAGKIELMAHTDVAKHLRHDWITELSRRTGKQVSIRRDGMLVEAPHAQIVPL